MRKLIETNQKYLVVCDNPKCDYTVPYTEESAKLISQYIDKPCPECGDNLLTREDYHKYNKIMSIINFLNRWFSWLTVFYSNKKHDNYHNISIKIQDNNK